MPWQALILKVFRGVSRSRRDCGNREADTCSIARHSGVRRRSRRDCGNREAAIILKLPFLKNSPQSPRLRQS